MKATSKSPAVFSEWDHHRVKCVIFQGNYSEDKLPHLTYLDGSCYICLLSMSCCIYIKDNKIQGDLTAKWVLQTVNSTETQKKRI